MSAFLAAHERACQACRRGQRCRLADELGQTYGSLFDAAGVPDPARPVSDAPVRALRRWRRGEVTTP